jgi:ABC-type spermidine/putrescine transport system permease subunit II
MTGLTRGGTARPADPLRFWRGLTIGLGYFAIVLIYAPIVWLGVMSISERPLTGVPWPWTIAWYAKLYDDPRWLEPIKLSTLLGVAVGLLCMVSATVVGRALPRMRRRGGLLFLFLLPLFVPGIVMGLALFTYFRSFLGIKTGLWSITLAHFVWSFPFALLSMIVVSARFDDRLLEAAADLGATPWQRFWHIEVPALMPGIVAAGFFGFLLSFNELERSVFLRGGETTLPLFAWFESASHTSNVALIYALSTIITVVSAALTVVALRTLFAGPKGGAG